MEYKIETLLDYLLRSEKISEEHFEECVEELAVITKQAKIGEYTELAFENGLVFAEFFPKMIGRAFTTEQLIEWGEKQNRKSK